MAAFDDIKAGLDMNEVAALLGTDPGTADQAVNEALSSLLGAFEGNVAEDPGAYGLAKAALEDHSNDLLDGGVRLGDIDASDGEAILGHVYSPQQIQALKGGGGGLLDKLLPILAPIVMAYIAKKLNGAMQGGRQGGGQEQPGGSILGDLLGSVLGGGRQAPQQAPSGGGDILGDLLGSVFGQEAPQQAPAPRSQPAPADGPFRAPGGQSGELRMDDGSNDAPAQHRQPQGGPAAGGLGDLLRQILVGR